MTDLPRDVDDDLRDAEGEIAAEKAAGSVDPWRTVKELQVAEFRAIIRAGKRILKKAEDAIDAGQIDKGNAYRELAAQWNKLGAGF